MKINLKSLALCAAMLSFGFANNAYSSANEINEAIKKGDIDNLYVIYPSYPYNHNDKYVQKIEPTNQDTKGLQLQSFKKNTYQEHNEYHPSFIYKNYILKPVVMLGNGENWLSFDIYSKEDKNKSLYVHYSLFPSKEITIQENDFTSGELIKRNLVTQKELKDTLNEYELSLQKVIAISQKMIEETYNKDNQKLPTTTEESKKKDLENITRIFNEQTVVLEEDTKEEKKSDLENTKLIFKKQNNKPIHYTLLEKNAFEKNTEMYIESKKVDDPTTATYKLYYNNNKFEINFTNDDTFNVVLTIGKKGLAKKTNIILDQNDNLNIKEEPDHYTKNSEVDAATYAKYVNLKYPKEIKDMEEIVKRIKLQKDLIFDTFRKNS